MIKSTMLDQTKLLLLCQTKSSRQQNRRQGRDRPRVSVDVEGQLVLTAAGCSPTQSVGEGSLGRVFNECRGAGSGDVASDSQRPNNNNL